MEATRKTSNYHSGSRPHLMDYYYRLRKRRWLVLSTLFLTVFFTGLFTFSMKPLYRATTKIIIDRESQRSPLTGQQLEAESYASQQLTFNTHFEIITSRPVLERVLAKVNVPDESLEQGLVGRFIAAVKSNVKRLFSALYSTPQEEGILSAEEQLLAEQIEQLRDKIEIQEVRNTRLLKIGVEDHDPQLAREIANTLADSYILYDSSGRLANSRRILDWLSKQLYGMKKKVEDAEIAFLAFKEKENLFSIEGKQRINVQKIEEMNASYIEARSKRLEVEAKIQELGKFIGSNEDGSIRNIPTFIKSDIVEDLYGDLLKTEIEQRKMSGVFKHKHPEMVKVNSKIQELQRKIRQQIQRALENAESERAVLIAREKALQGAMGSYEQEAIGTNRKELQYAILEREVGTNRELYNTLLAKVKEANVTDEVTRTNLRLVEPAVLPAKPVRPKKMLNLVLSVIFGLLTGVGLAFVLDYLDQSLDNREEAERALGLPVLAEIPLEEKREYLKKGKSEAYAVPSVLDLPLDSHFSEAFRILFTNLKFGGLERSRGAYLVTSSAPEEGKTTISWSLGMTMAKFGFKTLIIDTDLRMSKMEKILGINADKGLSDILTETFSLDVRSGTLGELTIGDIHKLLTIQEKSGVLNYHTATNVFNVSFQRGEIIGVDWPTRPPEKRLGHLLVQSGRISEEQAQIAVSKWQDTSLRFGQVLLHLGFLSPEELAGPLKLQMQENIRELQKCQHDDCQQARFSFQEDPHLISPESDPREAALRAAMGSLDGASSNNAPFLLAKIRECLCQVADTKLWILPSGKIPPNPAEFLASSRMWALRDLLRDQFDLIVLDSPPASTFSDASVLAGLCDGVIMVIRTGTTHIAEIRRTREQLEAVDVPILGTVLNMIDFKKNPYYHGLHSYKYDAYYAKEEKSDLR